MQGIASLHFLCSISYSSSSLAIVKIPIVFGLAFLNTLLHSFTVLPVVNISSTNNIFLLYNFFPLKSSYTPCMFFALSSLFNLLCSIMSFTLIRQSVCNFKLKLVFLDISLANNKLWLYPLDFNLLLLIGTGIIVSYFSNFSKKFLFFNKKFTNVLYK